MNQYATWINKYIYIELYRQHWANGVSVRSNFGWWRLMRTQSNHQKHQKKMRFGWHSERHWWVRYIHIYYIYTYMFIVYIDVYIDILYKPNEGVSRLNDLTKSRQIWRNEMRCTWNCRMGPMRNIPISSHINLCWIKPIGVCFINVQVPQTWLKSW